MMKENIKYYFMERLRILRQTNSITIEEDKIINTLMFSKIEEDNILANELIKAKFKTS